MPTTRGRGGSIPVSNSRTRDAPTFGRRERRAPALDRRNLKRQAVRPCTEPPSGAAPSGPGRPRTLPSPNGRALATCRGFMRACAEISEPPCPPHRGGHGIYPSESCKRGRHASVPARAARGRRGAAAVPTDTSRVWRRPLDAWPPANGAEQDVERRRLRRRRCVDLASALRGHARWAFRPRPRRRLALCPLPPQLGRGSPAMPGCAEARPTTTPPCGTHNGLERPSLVWAARFRRQRSPWVRCRGATWFPAPGARRGSRCQGPVWCPLPGVACRGCCRVCSMSIVSVAGCSENHCVRCRLLQNPLYPLPGAPCDSARALASNDEAYASTSPPCTLPPPFCAAPRPRPTSPPFSHGAALCSRAWKPPGRRRRHSRTHAPVTMGRARLRRRPRSDLWWLPSRPLP